MGDDNPEDKTPKPKVSVRDAFRPIQAFAKAIDALWNWEFGSRPTKNGFKRFLAAFCGAYLGIIVLGFAWFTFMSLWTAFWSFLNASIGANGALLTAISLALLMPLFMSIVFAWLISSASKDESTMLTLFMRALIFDVLLCIFFSTIFGILFGLKTAANHVLR